MSSFMVGADDMAGDSAAGTVEGGWWCSDDQSLAMQAALLLSRFYLQWHCRNAEQLSCQAGT